MENPVAQKSEKTCCAPSCCDGAVAKVDTEKANDAVRETERDMAWAAPSRPGLEQMPEEQQLGDSQRLAALAW